MGKRLVLKSDREVAKAQLEKAIPIIRKQVREEIIDYVEKKSCVIDWEDEENGIKREIREEDWQALKSKE